MPKPKSSKSTSLFDIRLSNLDHDVLVLKGNANDAASVLLSGKIALSVNEPITIKKVSLRLYSTLRLNWTDTFQTAKGTFPKNIKFEKKIYEHFWDPSDFNQYLNNLYANQSQPMTPSSSLSRNQSSSSLKGLGHSFRSKSSSNLQSISALTNSSSTTSLQSHPHVLVQGNYEFPFSAILPGSMPESVEGLPGASVVYRLEAIIDRGKFHNKMITKKHLRVVRTLTTDAVELSETVAVDNTWPKKVEYSLNVPCKAIAIGSGTPISFMLVPLMKGLRLGDIKIELAELYSYLGHLPPVFNGERIVASKFIKRPSESDPNFQMDKWEVDTFLKVPPSLSKSTQDCDILNHAKVRHKLKFVIGLINPDGHVSELRATLPVQLFISPFVSVSARTDDLASDTASLEEKQPEGDEELLFTTDMHSASHTSLADLAIAAEGSQVPSNHSSYTSLSGLMAPPLYEKHIYDRLWSDVSPIESPVGSGTATPRNNYYNDVQSHFSMSPLDNSLLTENLRQLSLQRQAQEADESNNSVPSTPRDRAVFDLNGEADQAGDYLTRGRPILQSSKSSHQVDNPILSPNMQSPQHLSRANSEHTLNSKVPSYTQALKSPQSEAPSPAYEPPLPGSHINLADLNQRIENHAASGSNGNKNKSSILTRGSSSLSLKNLSTKSSSKNSSGNSSPSNSRNISSSNLSVMGRPSNKTHSSGSTSPVHMNHSPSPATFSMTPISQSPGTTHHRAIVTQPSSSASDRTAAIGGGPIKSTSSLSLHNLHFMNKKKG